MPMYDIRCTAEDSCGYFNDVIISLSMLDESVCPTCDGPIERLVRPVRTTGPMPSKPVTIGQIGQSFESPAQLRAWHKKNPDAEFVDPGSKQWKDKMDRVRAKVHRKARAQGYADHEDEVKRKYGKAPDGRTA